MSDSQQVPPESGEPKKGKPPGKPESPASNRIILILLIVATILLVFYPLISGRSSAKVVSYSEFKKQVESGELNPTNVHELLFRLNSITWQDQPVPEDGSEPKIKPQTFQIPAGSMHSEARESLCELLEKKGIGFEFEAGPSNWDAYILLLLIAAPFVLLFILMLRRMGGAGSALAFGRSRGKVYAQDDLGITFDDVAGIDEAVEELKEVVEFLKSPGKYQALGGRIPKGVLLVGPPGTGKTLLAKAVAGEAGVPFVSLSGSDFVEMFVGVGAARVRDMFQQAAQRSPCIIFIDELDALGKARSAGVPGSHDEREQTLNALLVEMDGFGSDQSVIVMAATNRIDVLDPALLRPGRFDRHVIVDRPDIKGRERILKVHSTKVKINETVDLARIAKLTAGFVGADLANLVNEAALLAARKSLKCVTMKEFEEGFERVVAGLEKQSRVLDEEEKERTAYHECGHALIACSLPNADPVHKISIIPRGQALGYTMHLPDSERHNRTQTELVSSICCLLGGIAAEDVVYNETSVGAQNDLQRATDIARRMVTEFGMSPKLGRIHYSESRSNPFLGVTTAAEPVHAEQTIREIDLEVKRILDECNATVLDILRRRRAVLEQMTRELLEVETMDADHLKRILDEHHPGPQIVPGTHPKPGKAEGDVPAAELPDESESSETSDTAEAN
ncbi:ATP-dependent zinc metalloprotease FtsH [bacterium]|nr:ATP-dependent zinc metalloprotease FtsH [bacterium]